MPYTTLTAGTTITSSWANANVRDQVVTPFATSAARASAITSPIEGMVTHLNDTNDLHTYDGTNWVGWLVPSQATVATGEGTTSAAFADLATVGPAVTVTTGTRAIVVVSVSVSNSAGNTNLMGYAVSGASTVAAADTAALKHTGTSGMKFSYARLQTGLTSGSNTFTAKYRVSGGTGTYVDRDILVLSLP